MKERLQKQKRKGSSLTFVIIAVAFVGILSTIILRVTMINIETKTTDRGVKKDFYSAEAVMDKLNIALENICKDAMKDAYIELLQNYSTDGILTTDENAVQNKFAKNYLNNLISKIAPGKAMSANYTLADGTTYDPDVIVQAMNDAFNTDGEGDVGTKYLDIDKSKAELALTYDPTKYNAEQYLTLKNVKVNYKENINGEDMATWITTDIKLVVPKLSFEGANIYPDFTKYAIIGDEKVDALNGTEKATVTGNVYAGEKGLNVSGGNNDTLSIGGSSSRLVTRGDVNVQQTGGLTLGNVGSPIEVWAENYKTSILKDSASYASLTVYGESYVHDDLSLDAPYSNVDFVEGKYYGYTFNMDNTLDSITTVDSEYSSAIIINGRHSKLDMANGMTEILLGGRAFISRNKDTRINDEAFKTRTDIPIGESISVKADQNFYLVTNDDLASGFTNPMSITNYNDLIKDGKEPMSEQAKKTLRSYLNSSEPVTNYVYDLSATDTEAAMVYFYYNFKSQSAADRYFRDYCDKNSMSKKITSSEYLRFGADGKGGGGIDINISQNLSLLTAGNALWFSDKNTGLQSKEQTITDENEEFYKKESVTKAAKYKSYQLTLAEGDWSNYAQTGVSGHGDGDDEESGFDLVDKTTNRVFDTLMTKNSSESQYVFVEEAKDAGGTYGFQTLNGSIKYKAVSVDIGGTNAWAIFVAETNDSVITGIETAVSSNDVLTKAGVTDIANTPVIIVSNCNIKVDCSIRGLVISRNTVSFDGTYRSVSADSASLQDMFSAQKTKEGTYKQDKRFLKYFKCFASMSYGESVDGAQDSVDFSSCVKYVNWKKNNE